MIKIKSLDGREIGLEPQSNWSVKDMRASVEAQLMGNFKLYFGVRIFSATGKVQLQCSKAFRVGAS